MTVREIQALLDAEVFAAAGGLDHEVHSACGSDLMSDVLAYVKDQSVLLTGLVNPQVIRTAQMMDMVCVVLVRGKQPDDVMKRLADEFGIVLLGTRYRMFDACGLLHDAGLCGSPGTEGTLT